MTDAELDQCRNDSALLYSIISRRVKLKREGNHWKGSCPFHDDSNPSFAVYDNGFHCFACGARGDVFEFVKLRDHVEFPHAVEIVAAERGSSQRRQNGGHRNGARIVDTYDYPDEKGALLFQVVRMVPKDFRQRRPDGNGGWIWNLNGIDRVLYRLPELLRAAADATVFIAEGEKDCDALHERGLITTTNPGGAGQWRPSMSAYLRDRDVVILPDNDAAGEEHAVKVHHELSGIARSVKIVRLPGLPEKGDVSDWLAAGGTAEALQKIAAETMNEPDESEGESEQQPRGTSYGRLLVLSVDDIDTAPARSYLLKGLISPSEVSIWVGPPKCGKSFLLLYIAYMLSLARSVFGRRVKPTRVLYVAAEGEAGIANRIRALRIKYGPSENFHFIAQPADLLHDGGDKADLIAAAQAHQAQLIVLDTLSRLLAGGDENSPQDMGTFVRNVAEIRHDTCAHIAIVHHGTKASNGSNPRGHSCLTGADDALIEVLKLDDGSRQATVIHAKDDVDGMRWGFRLELVELGTDEDGDPITTLLTTEMAAPPAEARQRERLTNNEQIALQCLEKALKASGTVAAVGDDFSERKVVTEAEWRNWFYQGKPGDEPNTKRMAFNRARDALVAKGRVAAQHDFVWKVTAA